MINAIKASLLYSLNMEYRQNLIDFNSAFVNGVINALPCNPRQTLNQAKS
jgi:hypothetical protein